MYITCSISDVSTAGHFPIAKVPTGQTELHERATILQPGAREHWFYRAAASRSPVLTPRCYYQAIDEATGQSVLLLEDIAAPTSGQLVGATPTAVSPTILAATICSNCSRLDIVLS
jgi:hypothetical protein